VTNIYIVKNVVLNKNFTIRMEQEEENNLCTFDCCNCRECSDGKGGNVVVIINEKYVRVVQERVLAKKYYNLSPRI